MRETLSPLRPSVRCSIVLRVGRVGWVWLKTPPLVCSGRQGVAGSPGAAPDGPVAPAAAPGTGQEANPGAPSPCAENASPSTPSVWHVPGYTPGTQWQRPPVNRND